MNYGVAGHLLKIRLKYSDYYCHDMIKFWYSNKSQRRMHNPLYEIVESYKSEEITKATVLSNSWLSYRNKSMTFDEILEEAGESFKKYGLGDCCKYPTIVEIKTKRIPENKVDSKECSNSPDISINKWSNFPVYLRRFHINSIQQDEFMEMTINVVEKLTTMKFTFIPEPYYWIVYDPTLMMNKDGNAEIWIKCE
ncbi:unnamed protein product [Heterobilharzia americana]|nr:unnamed protein product [Heterobilharzia americana]